MKRLKTLFVPFALAFAFGTPADAGTSILVDVQSGAVLSADKPFDRWYPASLTKLMTTYIAFSAMKEGRLNPQSPVTISANAAKQPPSKMGYKAGNVLTLDSALKIMLVKSANDIAVAVGEAAGGVNYPDAMNAAAAKLGMSGSQFVNANGLHSTQNYSTARDLALLSAALRSEFPEYASYFGIEAIKYGEKLERNYNILLGRFDGADGMKTGFVCASGFNLVASATKDGRTLVAVVLGAMSQEQRAEKAANMLAAGFNGTASASGTLASLQPAGPVNTTAIDQRNAVCTEAAAADRWDGREIEGKIKFETPYIAAMTRQPVALSVGLLSSGTTAKSKLSLDDLSRIPVPAQKPQRAAAVTGAVLDGALRTSVTANP